MTLSFAPVLTPDSSTLLSVPMPVATLSAAPPFGRERNRILF